MTAKTTARTRTVHYVLSTHWDREWYQAFQDYRERLVRLMDNVIAGFDDGRLRGPFQTDGQAILLEDYLEIRPERRARVEQLVRERKFVVGPWYVLPDEFIVSGESIVRNLRLGREIARRFGAEPSDAGFVCDLFGHIGQLPQILRGFGIDNALLWRGVNHYETRNFIWEGVDGSDVVAYEFANIGYCDYAFKVRDADKRDLEFDRERNRRQLHDYIDHETAHTETDAVLLFDGGDHQEWDPEVYGLLCETMDLGGTGFEVRHSDLDAFVREMVGQRDRIAKRLKGELRETGKVPGMAGHQIHGVLSSRVWIKRENQECQNMLCHWAEPLGAFSALALGTEYPKGYLDVAWRWLIENHPHDSICGCSIDQVHEDMKYRFSQTRQIAELTTREASYRIAASIEGSPAKDEVRVVVFNPLPVDRDGPATLELEIPTDYPVFQEFFGFEKLPVFTIHGADGAEIPFQRVRQSMGRKGMRIRPAKFPDNTVTDRVTVALPLRIPAMGYTTLTVRPATNQEPKRYPMVPSLVCGSRAIENELLRVEATAHGTLTLTDRATGETYGDLLTFEERADIGDGWFHGVAVNDEVLYSSACASDVSVIENGKYQAALRVRTTMNVPEEFVFEGMVRSARRVPLVLETVVRLRAGSDHVEFETTIDNTAKDHRVRVLFPSGAKTATWRTDQAFDVVERNVALRADNHECFELEVDTKPQQSWSGVFDEKRGLAVVATGLIESAVPDVEERPIALTLFRGTRRTVNTDGEPEGQVLGPMTFRYAVKPLRGAPNRRRLFDIGQALGTGLRVVNMRWQDVGIHRQGTAMPAQAGFLRLDGGAVMTSCRIVDGELEVRVFNPETTKVDAALDWSGNPEAMGRFESVVAVDLESNPTGKPVRPDGRRFSFDLEPKKIVTWRFHRQG